MTPNDERNQPIKSETADLALTQSLVTESPIPKHREVSNDDTVLNQSDQTIGRYQVVRKLGQGGFGEVYQAYDPKLNRTVAIKLPREELRGDARATELYIAEARALARLTHPHIVSIYDVGQTKTNSCFLVSQFIEGCSLADSDLLRAADVRRVATVVAQIATALHYAHKVGIYHRDVKPGNVLIDVTGKVYIADFGIALTDDAVGTGPRVAGTGFYMSPEQIDGQSHLVDGRSDIYSLGVLLYELLTGKRPFQASSLDALHQQIMSIPPRPLRSIRDDVPLWLEQVCLKALAKRREDRWSTAQEMADALEAGFAAEPLTAALPLTHEVKSSRQAAFGAGVTLITLICCTAALLVVWLVLSNIQRNPSVVDQKQTLQKNDWSASMNTANVDAIGIKRLDVKVWGPSRNGELIEQAMPIRDGDSITIEVELTQPAYVFLAWIDTEGQPVELYPNDPTHGLRSEEKIQAMRSPIDFQKGWPVIGTAGMETVVLLVSAEPLGDHGELLKQLQLPSANRYDSVEESMVYTVSKQEGLVAVGKSQQRGIGKESVVIDQPVLSMLDRLKDSFEALRAIRIAHR